MPIFVSYSFKDEAVFSTLALALDAAGIERWDSASMSVGDSLAGQLRAAIGHCEICIFIATRRSIESPWCLAELGAFWGAGKKVFLFMADPDLAESTLPPQFKGTLRVDNGRVLIESIQKTIGELENDKSFDSANEFFKSCGEYGTERQWVELLDHALVYFDALGVTLSAWRRMHQFSKKVLSRAQAGCRLRFLLMHQDNQLLEGILYKGRALDSVIPLIAESAQYFGQLQTKHENIEVRQIRSGLPHFSLARTDQQLVLTQYLTHETWGAGPTWRCRDQSPLFEVAMSDFEQLWHDSVKLT
jgi:TIR domain